MQNYKRTKKNYKKANLQKDIMKNGQKDKREIRTKKQEDRMRNRQKEKRTR